MMQDLRSKLWIPAAVLAVLLLIDPLGLRTLPVLYVLFWLGTAALAVYALLPLWQARGKTNAPPAESYAVLIVPDRFKIPKAGVYLPDQNGELVLEMENGSVMVFRREKEGVGLRVLGGQTAGSEKLLYPKVNEYYTIRRMNGTQEQICFQVALLPY